MKSIKYLSPFLSKVMRSGDRSSSPTRKTCLLTGSSLCESPDGHTRIRFSLRTMIRKFEAQGSYYHSVLPSLLMTAKRQGKHPLTFSQTLWTADTPPLRLPFIMAHHGCVAIHGLTIKNSSFIWTKLLLLWAIIS
jgi:hypothetical protein